MAKIHKQMCLTAVLCILFLGGQATTHAQNIGVPQEPSSTEPGPRIPSAKRRILENMAKAVLRVLCTELGDCMSETSTDSSRSGTRESDRNGTPGFAGNVSSSPQNRSFSFHTPLGWQSYEEQSSVTVAQPGEYTNGNLTNGVILGLADLNNASLESGTENYVRALISNNKYLRRVGWPEGQTVNNVPCMTTRMEGQSPNTRYLEKVVVYTCMRSSQKLFYVVTVNSGPHANQFEGENSRITQSISFR